MVPNHRVARTFFMMGNLVKMSATMVGQRRKFLKLHWLKCLKQSQKRNVDQKINDEKPLIWSLSSSLRFSGRKSQSQQKLTTKFTHFTIQFRSKTLTHFTKLNSLKIKIYSSNTVSGWWLKKHLHCNIFSHTETAFSDHLGRKFLYVPVSLLSKIFVPEM